MMEKDIFGCELDHLEPLAVPVTRQTVALPLGNAYK